VVLVVQKTIDFLDDAVFIGADECHGPGVNRLGPFCVVPHHEDRLAEAGSFFLDSA
jgi:hypothetical protein